MATNLCVVKTLLTAKQKSNGSLVVGFTSTYTIDAEVMSLIPDSIQKGTLCD